MNGAIDPPPRLSRYPASTMNGTYVADPASFWRSLVIRGTRWQIDVLPTPPAMTSAGFWNLPMESPLE